MKLQINNSLYSLDDYGYEINIGKKEKIHYFYIKDLEIVQDIYTQIKYKTNDNTITLQLNNHPINFKSIFIKDKNILILKESL